MAASIIRGLIACLALAHLTQGERSEAASGARHHVLEVAPSGHLSRPHYDGAQRPPERKDPLEEAVRAPVQPVAPSSAMLETSARTGSKAHFWPWIWHQLGWEGDLGEHALEHPAPMEKKAYRLMSFNVYYGNAHYREIAELVAKVDPDIVNFQEAVADSSAAIIENLNYLNSTGVAQGQWKMANTWNATSFWCGLTAYRSDRWHSEWATEIPVPQDGDRRGICGTLLKRKEDDVKVCVWGTHPILRNNTPHSTFWVADAIKAGGKEMQNCELDHAAPSIFMCDCNTIDDDPVEKALNDVTGFKWESTVAEGYTQIHLTLGPHKVGTAGNKTSVNSTAGKSGCRAECQNELWAFSDHPPVYLDVLPPPDQPREVWKEAST